MRSTQLFSVRLRQFQTRKYRQGSYAFADWRISPTSIMLPGYDPYGHACTRDRLNSLTHHAQNSPVHGSFSLPHWAHRMVTAVPPSSVER